MKINGSFAADVTDYHVKSNQKRDGKTGTFDLSIGLTQEEARKRFGAQFEKLAFSSMYTKVADPNNPESVDKTAHLQDRIKPGANVVFERHEIEINGTTIREQPTLLGIDTVDGEARVIADLRIPIDVEIAERMGLGKQVNQTTTVRFNPEQGQFDFDGAKPGANGNGAGAEHATEATQA